MKNAPMLKSGRAKDAGVHGCSYMGCSCHNTKAQRRAGKRPQKRAETRDWKREAQQER